MVCRIALCWIIFWLLSSAPSNGAPQGAASDARWSLMRSIPNIGTGGTVTFEIDKTNYPLTSSTTLDIAVDAASTAGDADFTQGLQASIAAALNANVTYDPHTGILTFGPETVFPFTFAMTAGAVGANKANTSTPARTVSTGPRHRALASSAYRSSFKTCKPPQWPSSTRRRCGSFIRFCANARRSKSSACWICTIMAATTWTISKASMMDRHGSGILGHPLTGRRFAPPAAGGDGLLWSDAMRPIQPRPHPG
jgi:hypothetical protein